MANTCSRDVYQTGCRIVQGRTFVGCPCDLSVLQFEFGRRLVSPTLLVFLLLQFSTREYKIPHYLSVKRPRRPSLVCYLYCQTAFRILRTSTRRYRRETHAFLFVLLIDRSCGDVGCQVHEQLVYNRFTRPYGHAFCCVDTR